MERFKESIELSFRIRPVGIALAAVYALSCLASRQFSLDQFFLPAGIRAAALLIVPTRLWPYLLLGEYAYFATLRIPMIDSYGLVWVILASTLLMPLAMLVVRPLAAVADLLHGIVRPGSQYGHFICSVVEPPAQQPA